MDNTYNGMTTQTFDLQPVNSRKSFYGKCKVLQYKDASNNTISDLVSYTTTVARYNHTQNKMYVFGYYSQTTKSHIDSFLDFYGFDAMTKKQIEALDQSDPCVNK